MNRMLKTLLITLSAVLVAVGASADQIEVPHVFVNGTTADADSVNTNFQVLEDESNAQDLRIGGLESVTRVINVQVDTFGRAFTNGWGLGRTFDEIPGFKAGSLVRLSYHVPMRNDSNSWGGGYTEPQISFDGGGTWNSLGSSGYDGGVMSSGGPMIGSFNNELLIDPNLGADFSVQVRFYHKSYDGTLVVNNNHDINSISGTAPRMAGDNGNQHYTHVIVEEVLP